MREKKEETEKGKQREPRSKSSNQNRPQKTPHPLFLPLFRCFLKTILLLPDLFVRTLLSRFKRE
jgi:hypothetical protein